MDYWPYYEAPGTWESFKSLIKDLEKVSPDIYDNVIVKFGRENKSKFGYRDECSDLVIVEYVEQEVEVYRADAGVENIEVNLVINGSILLDGEKDTLEVSATQSQENKSESMVTIRSGRNNNEYRLVGLERQSDDYKTQITFEMEAERKKVVPKNNFGGSLTIENGHAYLNIQLDENTIKYADIISGHLYLNFSVETKKDCFYCMISKERVSQTVSLDVKEKNIKIPTSYNVESDDEVIKVYFSINYAGSKLYSSSKSSEQKITHKIKD